MIKEQGSNRHKKKGKITSNVLTSADDRYIIVVDEEVVILVDYDGKPEEGEVFRSERFRSVEEAKNFAENA